jgi:hypothetical protein
MNRRDFLRSTVASLALSGGVLELASAGPVNREVSGYLFYDERFPAAQRLAREMAGADEIIPVRGDVTQLWNGILKPASQRSPLLLAGVTTGSFYFCLKTLMRSPGGLDLSTSRIDRDLIAWSIRSSQSNNQGIASI